MCVSVHEQSLPSLPRRCLLCLRARLDKLLEALLHLRGHLRIHLLKKPTVVLARHAHHIVEKDELAQQRETYTHFRLELSRLYIGSNNKLRFD